MSQHGASRVVTSKAREVLNDCRVALSLLEDETDVQRWRVHWAAAVALIRAVGHVLEKVDGDDPLIKHAASAAFRQWKGTDPAHRIFRDFVERERNNLLKEYRSDVHPQAEIALAIEVIAQPMADGALVKVPDVAGILDNIYRPYLDGPWAGNDARDVLSEAISWWDEQLSLIEQQTTRRRSAKA